MKIGFGAGVLLLTSIGLAAILQTFAWEDSARWVAHTNQVINGLDHLALASVEAVDAAHIFVSNGDPAEATRSREDLASASGRIPEIERSVEDNPAQRDNLAIVRQLIGRQADTLLDGFRQGGPAAVRQALDALDRQGTGISTRAAILRMESEERRLLADRSARQARDAALSRKLFAAAIFLSIGLILFASWRVSTDIKRRVALEQDLAAKEEQYRQVVELAGDIIYRTDPQGRFTFCNQAALTVLHFTQAEVIGRSFMKLIRPDKRREAERFYLRQFVRRQKSTYYEFPVIDGNGRERWIGQNVQVVLEGDAVVGFQAIARDITERKRAEHELRKSRNFIERIAVTTPGILYVYDLVERRNLFSNSEVVAVLGYKPDDMWMMEDTGRSIFHPDDEPAIKSHHEALRYARDGEIRRIEYRARHLEGHWVWLSARDTAFERGSDGRVRQIVGIALDITARKAAQEKLAHQANYDSLTGLANRHYFWARLQGVLRRGSIDHFETSVCLFDVDHFKEVNDRFGHAAGDEVLEAVGAILRGELAESDIGGRLGGDEFCFALPGTEHSVAALVAERVRERLSTLAFGLGAGAPFSVTATFGVAESQPDMDAKDLLETADRTLYRAKAAGRNRVCVDI